MAKDRINCHTGGFFWVPPTRTSMRSMISGFQKNSHFVKVFKDRFDNTPGLFLLENNPRKGKGKAHRPLSMFFDFLTNSIGQEFHNSKREKIMAKFTI